MSNQVHRSHLPSQEESRFHRAVFDVLNTHSRLDLNLGLCISHLKAPDKPETTHPWLAKLSCGDKITELKKLIKDTESASQFSAWATRASSVRALRNGFAHGIWEYVPHRTAMPVGFRIPTWAPLKPDVKPRMSIAELEKIAAEVQVCFTQFMKWRHEHGL